MKYDDLIDDDEANEAEKAFREYVREFRAECFEEILWLRSHGFRQNINCHYMTIEYNSRKHGDDWLCVTPEGPNLWCCTPVIDGVFLWSCSAYDHTPALAISSCRCALERGGHENCKKLFRGLDA